MSKQKSLIEQDLDQLEEECSQLLHLLRDRDIGLISWQYLVGDRATKVIAAMDQLGMVKKEGQ